MLQLPLCHNFPNVVFVSRLFSRLLAWVSVFCNHARFKLVVTFTHTRAVLSPKSFWMQENIVVSVSSVFQTSTVIASKRWSKACIHFWWPVDRGDTTCLMLMFRAASPFLFLFPVLQRSEPNLFNLSGLLSSRDKPSGDLVDLIFLTYLQNGVIPVCLLLAGLVQ